MKNTSKILTVTIGTSAYNEENNIKNMLESVIRQNEETVLIKQIIAISDGSIDKTVEMAKSLNDPRIKVINDRRRLGKISRVNQLFKLFSTDVLVIIDSDMVMKDKNALKNIAEKFLNDKTTALVCGETEPLTARTFLESAINNYIIVRKSLEKEFCFGNTAYGAHAFLAYSKRFAKSLTIPKGILNDDAYSYFTCVSKGYKRYFASNAIALYRSPGSIKDHLNQSARHLAGGHQLKKYFGSDTIDKGFFVPTTIMIKTVLYQLLRNPIGYIFLKMLNSYCYYKSRKVADKLDTKWEVITTSKNLATN